MVRWKSSRKYSKHHETRFFTSDS